jgi:hypothetical protein
MQQIVLLRAVIAIIFLCFGVSAANAGSIGLSPMSTTVGSGGTFDLDISLSGNTELTVTSQLRISFEYNSAIIDPVATSFGSFFTSSFSTTNVSTYTSFGTFEIIELEVSGGSLAATTLVNELYATVTFQGDAIGFSLIDYAGSGQGGCCGGDEYFSFSLDDPAEATVVPEPTTALLLGVGLAGLTAAGRRRSHH